MRYLESAGRSCGGGIRAKYEYLWCGSPTFLFSHITKWGFHYRDYWGVGRMNSLWLWVNWSFYEHIRRHEWAWSFFVFAYKTTKKKNVWCVWSKLCNAHKTEWLITNRTTEYLAVSMEAYQQGSESVRRVFPVKTFWSLLKVTGELMCVWKSAGMQVNFYDFHKRWGIICRLGLRSFFLGFFTAK